MKITHIYTDPNGDSRFEDIEIPLFDRGEILLVEDTTGKGHRTKNLEKKERTPIFIHLACEIFQHQ